MNLRGSYRKLLGNSKSAMLAAIEIYNKPRIEYRDECFCILLINAWELALKAILSKNKQRIYYPKKPNKSYRTLTIQDSLKETEKIFPKEIQYEPVKANLDRITEYRNKTIHFYNQPHFGILVYGLAQTNIVNYRDLVLMMFDVDLASEANINLLPLGFGIPPDPIEFLQKTTRKTSRNKIVTQYLQKISHDTEYLEENGYDTGRFLTVFTVSLQSTKKISSADVVAGVVGGSGVGKVPIIERNTDPNKSHPLRQTEVLDTIGNALNGVRFTQRTFQAIILKYDIKNKRHLHWRPDKGGSPQYSRDLLPFLKKLPQVEIEIALDEYKNYLKQRRESKKNATP
jgi:hypothetical protein